jgi:hypothetical protein
MGDIGIRPQLTGTTATVRTLVPFVTIRASCLLCGAGGVIKDATPTGHYEPGQARPETAVVNAYPAISNWGQALCGILAKKQPGSGFDRTGQRYARMLRHGFAVFGGTPDRVTRHDVLSWEYQVGLSGRQPSPDTVGAAERGFWRGCSPLRWSSPAAEPPVCRIRSNGAARKKRRDLRPDGFTPQQGSLG